MLKNLQRGEPSKDDRRGSKRAAAARTDFSAFFEEDSYSDASSSDYTRKRRRPGILLEFPSNVLDNVNIRALSMGLRESDSIKKQLKTCEDIVRLALNSDYGVPFVEPVDLKEACLT